MNKAFEVIEARWLYDVDYDRIDVAVHRQSIVHSMVEFTNGTLKAQLSMPDMRLPIQYALAYPERIERPSDWREMDYTVDLTFESLERGRFPCFWLAVDAARSGKTYPAVLNAADEIAVELFLSGAVPPSPPSPHSFATRLMPTNPRINRRSMTCSPPTHGRATT